MSTTNASGSLGPARKRVIALLHGIRTEGAWAKTCEDIFSQAPDTFVVWLRYGWFPTADMLCPGPTRTWAVRRANRQLQREIARYPADAHDWCFVAHSFGTYVLQRLLEMNSGLVPRQIILCAAVAPADRWRDLMQWSLWESEDRKVILNEYSVEDIWPQAAEVLSFGFDDATGIRRLVGRCVVNGEHRRGHSEYFDPAFIERRWFSFLVNGTPPTARKVARKARHRRPLAAGGRNVRVRPVYNRMIGAVLSGAAAFFEQIAAPATGAGWGYLKAVGIRTPLTAIWALMAILLRGWWVLLIVWWIISWLPIKPSEEELAAFIAGSPTDPPGKYADLYLRDFYGYADTDEWIDLHKSSQSDFVRWLTKARVAPDQAGAIVAGAGADKALGDGARRLMFQALSAEAADDLSVEAQCALDLLKTHLESEYACLAAARVMNFGVFIAQRNLADKRRIDEVLTIAHSVSERIANGASDAGWPQYCQAILATRFGKLKMSEAGKQKTLAEAQPKTDEARTHLIRALNLVGCPTKLFVSDRDVDSLRALRWSVPPATKADRESYYSVFTAALTCHYLGGWLEQDLRALKSDELIRASLGYAESTFAAEEKLWALSRLDDGKKSNPAIPMWANSAEDHLEGRTLAALLLNESAALDGKGTRESPAPKTLIDQMLKGWSPGRTPDRIGYNRAHIAEIRLARLYRVLSRQPKPLEEIDEAKRIEIPAPEFEEIAMHLDRHDLLKVARRSELLPAGSWSAFAPQARFECGLYLADIAEEQDLLRKGLSLARSGIKSLNAPWRSSLLKYEYALTVSIILANSKKESFDACQLMDLLDGAAEELTGARAYMAGSNDVVFAKRIEAVTKNLESLRESFAGRLLE